MAKLYTRMLALFLCLLCAAAQGQDIIQTNDGQEIVGKVLHVGPDKVIYRYFSDASGPQYTLAKHEVKDLRLMAGAEPMANPEVIFEDEKTSIRSEQELIAQARRDAKAYYTPSGVFWSTMGSTLVYPGAGLVTGSVLSVVPPNLEAGYNPNRHLLKEPAYREAYEKQARKRKIGRAAAGFGAGAAVLSFVYMVVANVGK